MRENKENIIETIIREVLEETSILVEPKSVLVIEDLDCKNVKCANMDELQIC